jgi:hypothetical protein
MSRGVEPSADDSFPTTQWGLVQRAGAADPQTRQVALGELIQRYAPALHAYVISAWGFRPAEAEDAIQEFLLSKILERELLRQAEQRRGRLRALLVTTLNRFLISAHRKQMAQKRSAGKRTRLEDVPELKSREPDPTAAFDLGWARGVLTEILTRMEKECRADGRLDIWGIFEARVVGPILRQDQPQDYAALVKRYGLGSPAQASNLLISGKRKFVQIMRNVIGEYATSEKEIDDEIAELEKILSGK